MVLDIKSLTKTGLEDLVAGLGERPFRAGQVMRWLYRDGVRSFDEMSDIPASLREKLKSACHISRVSLLDMKRSRSDGTAKYLLKLEDQNAIEAVFLPETRRNTVCLSTQVGCKFGCSFCASAVLGFVRNLSPAEILDEVLFVRRENPLHPVTNVVFMGIGEPFDNYDNVMKAIRILNDPAAFNIGARRITVSTCGLIPGIKRFPEEGLQVELSISLHSADDAVRSKLVPANRRYPLKELMAACREYTKKTNRVVTFEYILIKGVNSSREDALKLANLLKGLKCKVNTISYNPVREKDHKGLAEADAAAFTALLKSKGVAATHRRPRGEDISAACGQLRISGGQCR